MSLRSRVTLLTALLLLLSSTALAVIAYTTAARVQLQSIDRALETTLNQPRLRTLIVRPEKLDADDFASIALAFQPVGEATVTTLRDAGTASEPLPLPSLTAEQIQRVKAGAFTVGGTPDFRVMARQFGVNRGTVIAGTPLDELAASLQAFALGMVLSVSVITLAGGAIAWEAMRRFFRPVDTMVSAAQAIAHGDINRRVPPGASGTELGELSEALNLMIASLTASLAMRESSEERLRAFVSDASHEIRTPLTVIRGYIELLRRERNGDDGLESRALARIDAESERLQRLVEQLLLLQRLGAGTEDVQDVTDLAPVVREIFGDLSALDPGRNVDVSAETATVPGAVDTWREVVSNIVQNIHRHTPAGSPVAVTLGVFGEHVQLRVDDAGPGIPAELRARVVERFARLDPGSTGYGLGMSVIRAVVDGQQGSLELLDSPLGGLSVRITTTHATEERSIRG